jgi:penicillin-binding protein 1C
MPAPRARMAAFGLAPFLVLLVLAAAWMLDRACPPDLSRVEAVGAEVLDRRGRLLAVLPAPGGVQRLRTGVGDVSRPFLDLLVQTEDRRFWSHHGVDPWALARAVGQWARAGHVVSGGSTLAMQAARLLEPRPRTLRSKLIETARALQLEWRYGREGVLGIWLTLAPYGGNLEGVRAGARAWFGASAAALDPAQAALLVALPRRPEALRPDRHADRAERVRDRVLAEAAGAPMPTARIAFPRHAAQAVTGLGAGPVIRTTLDLPLQVALERLAADRLAVLPERVSVALLVADASSREILALASGRWGDEARSGALDLTRAVRSPGSALKPFLYAMAFQEGIARPDTVLTDLPRHFGGYAPENYLRGHAGRVTAADALRRSLNLPAVALLEQIGPLRFSEGLRAGGARPRLPGGADASLPLALGGAGLTMREMAGLYAGLASTHGAGPLRMLPGAAAPGVPQSEAQRIVADILTQPFPQGGPPGVGWKTGTSWGGRDAWALGFDRKHVAAVWVGRPDGTAMPGATGRALALPVLAQVFGLLPPAPRGAARPVAMAPAATAEASLRLLFPPPGAVLSGDGPMTLRAMGGRRPLTFLVDGAPLEAAPSRREAGWSPSGPGFYTITVMDADGLAARAPVRVR